MLHLLLAALGGCGKGVLFFYSSFKRFHNARSYEAELFELQQIRYRFYRMRVAIDMGLAAIL
jgi:hypothetical protein